MSFLNSFKKFFIKKKIEQIRPPKKSPLIIRSQDIKAIAGDDIMATQLDLARAYMELDKKGLARKILEHVIQYGNPTQQVEARELIAAL